MRYFKREYIGHRTIVEYYRTSYPIDINTNEYEYYNPEFNEWTKAVGNMNRKFCEYVYTEITEGDMMLEMI